MHRLLRFLMLWLIALALPIQGASAATAMALASSPAPAMHVVPACPHHAMHDTRDHGVDKAGGCGACCGPTACQRAELEVAPVAEAATPAVRAAAAVATPQFLTDGPDRPPHPIPG